MHRGDDFVPAAGANATRVGATTGAATSLPRWIADLRDRSTIERLCGVGLDLVDIASVSRHAHRAAYRRQLCGAAEIDACLGSSDPGLAFATVFALKEACMKALGAGIREGIWFRQIEVESDAGGANEVGRSRLLLRRRALERFEEVGADTLAAAVVRRGPTVMGMVLIGTAPRRPLERRGGESVAREEYS